MGRPPLVAVVTPVYNGGKFIRRALLAVQSQTYRRIVHVVLDNASTDETAAIVAEFAANGAVPLSVSRNESLLDQVSNWNRAMSLVPAEARYVKLLCADDGMREDAIEKLVAVAERDPDIDYVGAGFTINGVETTNALPRRREVFSGAEFMRLAFHGRTHRHPWPHMFFRARPEFLRDPYRPERFPSADTDFVFRMLMSRKVGMVHEPLYESYRGAHTLTTAIGGSALFHCTNYERLVLYGRRVLSDAEYADECRRGLLYLRRLMVLWLLTGNRPLVTKTRRRLASLGIEVRRLDIIAMAGEWPLVIVRNRLHRLLGALGFDLASLRAD